MKFPASAMGQQPSIGQDPEETQESSRDAALRSLAQEMLGLLKDSKKPQQAPEETQEME